MFAETRGACVLTFEADIGREVRCGVGGHNTVLGPGTMGGCHDVETHDSVALLELGHVASDFMDGTGDIVSLVALLIEPLGQFPVLGVGASILDLDHDLISLGLRDW